MLWISTEAQHSMLPENVTHYLVPDCSVARDYLEIFEAEEMKGIIFMRTVTLSVSIFFMPFHLSI